MQDFQILFLYFKIIENWWWVWLPLVLFYLTRELYLWWKNENYFSTVQWITLEIKIPEEVAKTPKAMEQVLHGLHGIHDPLNWKEKWIDGRILLWFSLEIVGIDGVAHFYVHLPGVFRRMLETNLFSQYPDIEIAEVQDYTKNVPQDMPTREWDFWGTDFILTKPDAYPLRTYKYFETGTEKEEKRIDPLASLLELLSSLQQGEQIWIQILARPVIGERNWQKEGEKAVNKIIGKKEKHKQSFAAEFAGSLSDVLISGKPPESLTQEKEDEMLMWKLTPGQQDVVKAIEENVSKLGFESNIRFLYIGRSDVYSKPKGVASFMGILKQFGSQNLNGLKPDITKTKVTYGFGIKERRIRFRKRQLFRMYQTRWFPKHRKSYIFSTEELATLYHFPGRMVAPAPFVPRVEVRKGEPPVGLPME